MFGLKAIHLGFTLIAVLTSPVESVDCLSEDSLLQAFEECFKNEGLPAGLIQGTASVQHSILGEHSEFLCGTKKDSFVNAMECIGGITRNCIPESERDFVPEPKKWGLMTSYTCDHRRDVDFQCHVKQNPSLKECGKRKAREYLQSGGMSTGEEFRCFVFEAQFECAKEILSICGCPTAKVYSDIVLDIVMPTSCQKNTKEESRLICFNIAQGPKPTKSTYPTTSTLLPTPAPLLPLSTMSPVASCTSVYRVKRRSIKCFTDQNIEDEDLFSKYKKSTSYYAVVEALLAKHGAALCSSHKVHFAAAVACTFRLTQNCLPDQYRKLLPDPSTVQPMVDVLCQRREDIDFNCVVDKSKDTFECGRQKGSSYAINGGDTSPHPLRCFSIEAGFMCNRDEFKSCGCKTAKLYSDMVIDLLYPDHSSCPGQDFDHHRLSYYCEESDSRGPIGTSDQDQPTTASPGESVDSHSENSLLQAIDECNTNEGLPAGLIHETAYFQDYIFAEHGDFLCSTKKDSFVNTMECIGGIARKLYPESARGLVSEPKNWGQMTSYMCDHRKDVDFQCVMKQYPSWKECNKRKTREYIQNDEISVEEFRCLEFKARFECAKESLNSCGCPTAKVYSDMSLNIVMPTFCQKNTMEQSRLICSNITQKPKPTRTIYSTTFKPLPTPAPLLPLSTMSPVASCTSLYRVKRRTVKCFTDQNIKDEDLFNKYKRSTSYYALADALLAKHGASFCSSHKVRFAAAVACTFRITQNCMPYQYRKLLPSPSTAQPMVDVLCQHREDIDLNCAVDKSKDLFECGRQKGSSYASSGGDTSIGPLRCFTIEANLLCNKDELKSCGCKTTKVYSDMVTNVLYTDSSCPGQDLDQHRLICEERSDNHGPISTSKYDQPITAHYALESVRTCLDSKQNEISNCYTSRSLYYNNNRRSLSTQDIFSGSILLSVMVDNINTICTPSVFETARQAIHCEERIVNQCAASKGHWLANNFSINIQIFNRLCENRKDIDLRCAVDKMANLDNCPKFPHVSLGPTMPKEQRDACQYFLKYAHCIKTHLSTCGFETAKVYADIIHEYHMPITCNMNYINTITCDGNTAGNLACTFWQVILLSWFGGVISLYMLQGRHELL